MFGNRSDAGSSLAHALESYRGREAVVLGLPRGGLVVAAEVANRLELPLDIVVARKLGHPGSEEFAIGAVSEDGQVVLFPEAVARVPAEWVEQERAAQLEEVARRRAIYVGGRPPLPLAGKTAILVDDGIATGYTMEAALKTVLGRNPAECVVAAPIASTQAVERLSPHVSRVVALEIPTSFYAVGQFYRDFRQVEDPEVIRLLNDASRRLR